MYISIVTLIFVQVQNAPHEAKLSHELIAAAASYEVRVLIYILSPTKFTMIPYLS